MERVVSLTSFEEQQASNEWLEYWLTRPPEERLAEVDRLRREFAMLSGNGIHKDFADLCARLNAKNVDYLIVGGYAVAFHGSPRSTAGFDILLRPAVANVERASAAVQGCGVVSGDVGRVPNQVHLMTSISGLTWEAAWDSRSTGTYGGVPVTFIGREALLTNKRAAGRAKDLADVEALQRARDAW